MGVADLLRQLGTLESCSARVPTAREHDQELVPSWCELVLEIERDGKTLVHYLRRHDGELIIEVLSEVLRPRSLPQIRDRMWAEMDATMKRLMNGARSREDRQYARGLAYGLALIIDPFASDPDIDAVRSEALERWES